MNTQTLKKPDIHISKGQTVTGKWHKKSYHVVKELGSGAIGTVYLCVYQNVQVALKVSKQSHSITSEVNVLKAFKKVQGHSLGPSLIDTDDYIAPNGYVYSFYVMEYISGDDLPDFINRNGQEWLITLLIGFAKDLQALHDQGYVFGDLKTDNLIVSRRPAKLKWVDVGGTTLQGRAIKEYTEFYDRAYWQMGTRKADPGYDLFALAMVVLRIFYPDGFSKGNNPRKTLNQKIQLAIRSESLKKLLIKMINGEMNEAIEVKDYLLEDVMKQTHHTHVRQKRLVPDKQTETSYHPFLEVFSILSVSGLCYMYVTLFL
ncbi:serine/threonine protein kinase [Gracilibacillus ureilyticus]|uniref:Serine/threonine protein kinase n=1 Tax=Gracilibacillus ureilyticus TaxID=531814 RepID=A0A1H9VM84_9BACI|nr:protein kinase [Gracilibacillus ureilyticus]SES22651.1 serine/threonine protein kinase [Gracilibacillus ureilyticus]